MTRKSKLADFGVYRTRPLPTGELHGRFLITESLIRDTRRALVSFATAGLYDGGHEGMAFWAGREVEGATILLQVIVPECDHSSGRVMASREAVGRAARAARSAGLGILCQIHSHPGWDGRHSDGDDDLILLPFEGMLSVVVPFFGAMFSSITRCCVHQFQASRWVLCSSESVVRNFTIVPPMVDLRE